MELHTGTCSYAFNYTSEFTYISRFIGGCIHGSDVRRENLNDTSPSDQSVYDAGSSHNLRKPNLLNLLSENLCLVQ